MSNELVAFERMLEPLKPHFAQALAGAVPVDRLVRSVVISVERLPKLLECSRQSLLNSAMSAACLGLEVDGVTGQAFILPFAGKAQLVIGYKGMNTMAARSGFTVQGEVVREGDGFEYELGDKGFVRHRPKLGNRGPIIGAWATASAHNRPSIISVMGIDDIMAVKARSPGGKKSDSPWNDPHVGFPAMASKTVKRRLARSMPLNVMHLGAALDEAFEERGKHAWIDPQRGLQIEGEADGLPRINHDQRGMQELLSPVSPKPSAKAAGSDTPPGHPESEPAAPVPTAADYFEQWKTMLLNATRADQVASTWNNQKELHHQIAWTDEHPYETLKDKVIKAVESMRRG